jgi:DnaJ-class molecular chaperone
VYHPDFNSNDEEKFKEINEAYRVLGDPVLRKQYEKMSKVNIESVGEKK